MVQIRIFCLSCLFHDIISAVYIKFDIIKIIFYNKIRLKEKIILMWAERKIGL